MSGIGPRLPTWALQQVDGYLRYTGRGTNIVAEAARDSSPTPTVHRSVMLFCAGWREVICSRIMLRSVNFNLNKIVSFHN